MRTVLVIMFWAAVAAFWYEIIKLEEAEDEDRGF